MQRVGRFWFCGQCGERIPVAQTLEPPTLPPDHPFASLVAQLPTPIAFALTEFFTEPQPYIALHRLCDAAEIITRFFTIIALSDLLRRLGHFPLPVQIALTEKIERPTFGAWKDLLQTACENLPKKEGKTRCFVDELPEFVQNRWLPALGSGSDDPQKAIIALRNSSPTPPACPTKKPKNSSTPTKNPLKPCLRNFVSSPTTLSLPARRKGEFCG